MNFDQLKKNRKSSIDKINTAIKQDSKPSYDDDSHEYWKPTVDKNGNGYAVIRFLPGSEKDELPWAKLYTHGFQGPGGWYIENSLTTLGNDDPVSEYNSKLWNSGVESDKEIARKQKRRLSYISNIYVVDDPSNPDNNGKVFKYKYGKKIFDKIQDLMNPEFPGEEAINPFDLWEGANFKMKIRNVEGYRNYDKSEFDQKSALAADDQLKEIYESQFDVSALVAEDKFKTYNELATKLNRVLGIQAAEATEDAPSHRVVESNDNQNNSSDDVPFDNSKSDNESSSSDDDDPMAYFNNLANS